MKVSGLFILTLRSLILVFIGVGLFFYSSVTGSQESASDFKAGEFLVKFKGDEQIYKFQTSVDQDIFSIIKNYQNQSEIEYLEPNYLVQATAFPNDPDYPLQGYLNAINIKNAWSKDLLIREQEKISRQSIIAILDTGVDLDHPDLKDKIWLNTDETATNNSDNDRNGYASDVKGWDFVDGDADPNPSFAFGYDESAVKHGTIVAGIAAAASHNQQGITGVSWFSQIMPLRVLDSTGSGDVFSVIQAINYAISNGADVINMSFVGSGFSQSLFNTISRAFLQDILIVAAAGNTDPGVNGVDLDLSRSYPVCYDGADNMVIGVASVGQNLAKSNFSNYGSCIDLAAPGESFYSTQAYQQNVSGFTKFYDGYWSGTSLSSPLVSGTLAMIKALRPSLTASEIRDIVLENAKDIDSSNPNYRGKLGAGLLDAGKALEAALTHRLAGSRGKENNLVIAGLGLGSFPQLKILKTDGSVFKAFYPYSPLFNGPINVAAGDVNGDGQEEVITGAGEGGGPHLRIFNIEGQLISHFFAFDKNFRGGVNVAVADVTGDGVDEIITGLGKGSQPEVKIFDYQGNLIRQFLAYDAAFLGGVKVALGDIDQDGKADIVTGAGAGGGPQVRVFDAQGKLVSQFFAYNQNFKGGVNVAVGDVLGDQAPEIIASIEKNSLPTVRVFNYRGVQLANFFAYDPSFLYGVNLAAGDIDNDGIAEIITGPGIGGQSELKIFDSQGRLKFDILAHEKTYQGGVRPAMIRY